MPARDPTREPLLTPRDEDLLMGLTGRFRLVTAPLVARLWDSSEAFVARRLRRLAASGLVLRSRVLARPLLDLVEPVMRWAPGDPDPDFGRASYRLKSRWVEPPVATTLYVAGRRAAHLFGGSGGRLDFPLQVTHDLHVCLLYVDLRARDPLVAARWRGEETLRVGRKRGKVPDAVLVDHRGRPAKAIEFGGSYEPERLRVFHRVCSNKRQPYEVW
jgi:hypothetical protein